MSSTAQRQTACRFCKTAMSETGPQLQNRVCPGSQCQMYMKDACREVHSCGHLCSGIKNEETCLPCLNCKPSHKQSTTQSADDMCSICFTETLSSAPSIQLNCGHIFHFHCTKTMLEKRWSGPRITFGFSQCPICKKPVQHPALESLLTSIRDLREDVTRKAMTRLEYEGLRKADAITKPGGVFYQNPEGFAIDRYAYYLCFKCRKAYFGGGARCENQVLGDMGYDPKDLVCGACSNVTRAQTCATHGADYMEYKCRYCCSMAVYFCFGTTHFCNMCHNNHCRITRMSKTSLPTCPAGPNATKLEGAACPLQIHHPPTGEEFALGCGMCLDLQSF